MNIVSGKHNCNYPVNNVLLVVQQLFITWCEISKTIDYNYITMLISNGCSMLYDCDIIILFIGRAIIESETRKAQELSLACDSLLVSIKNGHDGQPIPLAMQLDNVKQVVLPNDFSRFLFLTRILPCKFHYTNCEY